MSDPTPAIAWTQTTKEMGYLHEEGRADEGTFRLGHPGESGLVEVGFAWPMPEGVDVAAHMARIIAEKRDLGPDTRAYWRLAGTMPFTGVEQGYFATHDMAHAVLEDAARIRPTQTVEAILSAHEFRESSPGTWERKAPCGRLVISVVDQSVHLRFDRRGSKSWTNLARLWLSKPGHNCTVYANWPTWMDSLPALAQIVAACADYADRDGMTVRKSARRGVSKPRPERQAA